MLPLEPYEKQLLLSSLLLLRRRAERLEFPYAVIRLGNAVVVLNRDSDTSAQHVHVVHSADAVRRPHRRALFR